MYNFAFLENNTSQKSTSHNVQKCNSCSYTSRSPFFMRNHMERHLSPEFFDCDKNLPIYQCKKDCNFKTNLIVFLKQHLKEFHKMRLKDYELFSTDYKIQNYVCQKCSFSTYSMLQLLIHLNKECRKVAELSKIVVSRSVKWHSCNHCPFKTKRKCYLKTHSKLKHPTDENIQFFQCSQCDFQTKWKIGLRKHTLYKHTAPDAVKWYYCDQCPYKAKTNYDLTDHRMWKHTSPEEVVWFQCLQCPYRAKKKSKLKQHEITQHLDAKDIKWLECDQCEFKTKTKRNLKAHKVAKHTALEDITWFECGQCPYKGKCKRKLKQHVVARHNKEK